MILWCFGPSKCAKINTCTEQRLVFQDVKTSQCPARWFYSLLSAGVRSCSYYFYQQDRGLPGLPEQSRSELQHRQCQELRDEHPDPGGRRWLCEWESRRRKAPHSEISTSVCGDIIFCWWTQRDLFDLLSLQREFPVPEQFKTVWDGSKLVTEPTEIAGWDACQESL